MFRAHRICLGVAVLSACGLGFAADPDLADYRTVETAITTKVGKAGTLVTPPAGYLGVAVATDPQGKLTVAAVAADSPAARAGVQAGDRIDRLDGKPVANEDAFDDLLAARAVGEPVKLTLTRKDKALEVEAKLETVSRPLAQAKVQAALGIQVTPAKENEGVTIDQVVPGSPAERAKLKPGEVVLQLDGQPLASAEKLKELLAAKKPDDTVTLTLLLAEKPVEMKVRLAAESLPDGRGRGFDFRGGGYWTKDKYKIAIIGVEYPDVKHNPKIPPKAWEDSMFSKGTYTGTSATGQQVHGSMHDYYWEQSHGKLSIEGKAFDYVEVGKKRSEYATDTKKALLTEAMDKLLAREGKDALKGYDGVFFIYAGERMSVARGSLYWPHKSTMSHQGQRWQYFICNEGGSRMGNISVFCHEFGHMLGLPDLYARPENPGMEGVGIWCAMANQAGNGRPQHFSVWSKEKLGWVAPVVIDPRVKQKLVLAPIEDDPKQCLKVLAKADGSEYYLIENRKQKGFDKSLPAEGLLIWRVINNRPVLEESHGVEGPRGPALFATSVPYPSPSNDAFTPYTTPSSRSQLGGGLPVYITNIRRLPDGKITFHIGYEYQ